jgi:hypothetical protein
MASAGSFWNDLFKAPVMTQSRAVLALAVAVAADGVQIMLGPLGWTFADEFIDLAAMVLICWLVGFHPLLLPTFVIELFPLVDMLPTWTACTAAVLVLRKRSQVGGQTTPGTGPQETVIDIEATPSSNPGQPRPPKDFN